MQANVISKNGGAEIRLLGRFDFNAHREFRAAMDTVLADAAARDLMVDLGGVEYLDSSALGMLLMLRDKAKASGRSVALTNCRGVVKQVLDIANFSKLFNMA
jgi:HptB-dependent secretion and biofilm anti anti-sigma factor